MATRTGRRVLLVEGRDDREVVYQLCNRHGLDNRAWFEVEAKDGYDSLRSDIELRIRTGVEIVGAVVDADEDLELRWESLRTTLASRYRVIPKQLPSAGLIHEEEGLPRLGVWIMPDNTLPGMLESFMARLVRDDDELIGRANDAVAEIAGGPGKFTTAHIPKAIIHTWLAWQQEPGTPMGQAVTKHYLDGDHELAVRFLEWLGLLFRGSANGEAPASGVEGT